MWSNLIYVHDKFYIIVPFIVQLRTGTQTGYGLTAEPRPWTNNFKTKEGINPFI